MQDFKPYRWFAIIITGFMLLPVLHLYDTYHIPQKLHGLAQQVDNANQSYRVYLDVSGLVSDCRQYMLHEDPEKLETFNRKRNRIIKREIELKNAASSPARKEQINQLISLTDRYTAFVQEKIVPAVSSGTGNRDSLWEQHDILSSKLLATAEAYTSARQQGISRSAGMIINLERDKRFLSITIMVCLLVALGAGTNKYFLPLFRRFYRYEQLYRHIKSASIITDSRGRIKNINTSAKEIFHLNLARLENKPLNELANLYPQMQNVVQPAFDVIWSQKEITNHQVIYTYGGERFLLTVDYYPLFLQDRVLGTAIMARPVEIQRDKHYLFETIESERKKISIEIHDWIGRNMSPIIHSLDYILQDNGEKLPARARSELVKLREHCQKAAADMRSIMNDIHPYLIDKVGLIPALESHARTFEQNQDISVYLYYQDRSLSLKKSTEIVIYRIIQEALTNVAKHSNATEVDIYFSREDEKTLKIEIMDNGDPPPEKSDRKGLWSMKERANLAGGDVVYDSTDSGFTVTVTVPLPREE